MSSCSDYGTASPPPSYHTDEQRPLVDKKSRRLTCVNGLQICQWIFIFIFLAIACIHLSIDHHNVDRPDVWARIQRLWKSKTENHVSYNKHLDQERNERIAADEKRLERLRADIKRHEAQLIEIDAKHEKAWEAEEERRRTVRDARDAQVTAREQAIWRKEEDMRRDEQHRKRSRLVWDNLTPDHRCLSFESRRYTAQLANVPTEPDVDGLKWCMETEIDIRGERYAHPRRCVRKEGKIVAEWITHSNEPTCRTYWDHHVKKECHGYHKRIVEAKLENHQPPWDNWEHMCYSTPSHFNFAHYDHPDICFETAHNGIFGRWFVTDNECP